MYDQRLWWQQPMVIMAHAHDYNPGYERDPAKIEELVRWKREAGFDVEHLLVNYSMFEGTGGEDSRAYCFKNFHGYREDWLSVYLPIAKQHGLRVLIYFNCHWFKFDAFPEDYFVVDAAGTPKVIYGDGGEICCQGPFRAWSERLAEDLGRYPIDGVFLDGPVKDACWCPHCRAAYQTRYGTDMPDAPSASPLDEQARYQDFIDDMSVGYIEAFARGLRVHNPDAVLYCNGGDSRQMAATRPWTQLVGEEGGFVGYGPLDSDFPFTTGRPAKELEHRAHDRARVIFCDSGYKVYDYHVHPQGEIARMYAGTLSNGASPWFLVYRPAVDAPGTQTVYRYNQLIHDYRDALANGESLAEAAILQSPANLRLAGQVQAASGDDVHKREATVRRLAVPRHREEFNGLYAAFARSGYPFAVVEDDVLLEGRLPACVKLLVLPGVSAISDRLADWLRGYVAGGGAVLATFDTGLFTDTGERRVDSPLAEVFGAKVDGDLFGPSRLDYFAVTDKNALTTGIRQPILPCPEYWHLVNAAPSAEPLLYYYEKMPRRYAALPPISNRPAALLNRFGDGRVVYLPSAVGSLSLAYHFPDLRLLLANAARLLAPPPVVVEGGDEFVETTLRRGADGSIVAHFINWAAGERPASRAIPLGPLQVSIRLPKDVKATTVHLALAGQNIDFTRHGEMLHFTLLRLEEYEMAIIR